MTEHNFDAMRKAMVSNQLRTTAVNDPRVVAAMADAPRERFVPADVESLAYLDRAVRLSATRAMPAPMVLGRLLTEARTRAADRALIVGAATGYAAAVLAALVADVVALEEDDALAAAARTPLPGNVRRVSGPLADGWAAGAPYSLILIDGAVEHVPDALAAQLADGGRLVAPLIEGGVTRLAVGRKAAGALGFSRFADAEAPALPGFALPRPFRF